MRGKRLDETGEGKELELGLPRERMVLWGGFTATQPNSGARDGPLDVQRPPAKGWLQAGRGLREEQQPLPLLACWDGDRRREERNFSETEALK